MFLFIGSSKSWPPLEIDLISPYYQSVTYIFTLLPVSRIYVIRHILRLFIQMLIETAQTVSVLFRLSRVDHVTPGLVMTCPNSGGRVPNDNILGNMPGTLTHDGF